MKFATYHDGSRDGQLLVVSRDLTMACYASGVAQRLQQVLDDWAYLATELRDIYDNLNAGRVRHAFTFDPRQCLSPLPRAYQWINTASYPSHAELVHAGHLDVHSHSSIYRGGSDHFLRPQATFVCAHEDDGIDFAAGLAVITGDITAGTPPAQALEHIHLLMLVNDIHLRTLPATEAQEQNLHTLHSNPATAFSPVAVTPDELGTAWRDGRVHLPLQCTWSQRKVGMCDAGADMPWHFGQVIAHLCKMRDIRAGSIVGSGPVNNFGVERDGHMDWPKGYSSIVQKRAMDTLQGNKTPTEFMRHGDTLHIEMKGPDGLSIFGAIAQELHTQVEPSTKKSTRPAH